MQWTGLNDLREKYLSFFESKNHTRMASASLVPQGDKSLLLINSGMAPLKKFFLGQATPPNKRVTTCQKCIRTPDIESVGKTARHGTYFEMLGNFSFGDYFKTEAIEWAWEFLTKTLEIPAEKLWITIFESDDEAEQIWENHIGIPHDRIIRLGKKDNFWEHGSGPCGPCSEIHFDRGEAYGPFENFEQASDCDRVIEIWNLVFSQFDSDGNGHYEEMKNNPSLKVEIGGHTDNVGSVEANKKLSAARAKAVYDHLTANGIDASRLSFRGYGETKPIASNDTPEGRAENRRVEMKVEN